MSASLDTGTILEIVIALSFIYFLLSCICSAINEGLASVLRWRAKDLKVGLAHMLDQAGTLRFYADQRIQVLGKVKRVGFFQRDTRWWKRLAQRWQVRRLGSWAGGSANQNQLQLDGTSPLVREAEMAGEEYRLRDPSYVPSATAAAVILDIRLRGDAESVRKLGFSDKEIEVLKAAVPEVGAGKGAAGPVLAKLRTALDEGGLTSCRRRPLLGKLDAAEKQIVTEFDGVMDRVSGWYKRKSTIYIGLAAVLVVCLLNADTINITRHLAVDQTSRLVLVSGAEEVAKLKSADECPVKEDEKDKTDQEDDTTTDKDGEQEEGSPENGDSPPPKAPWCHLQEYEENVRKKLSSSFPLGWNKAPWNGGLSWSNAPSKFLGLLLTVIAISLGGPFWFQMISRLTPLRATGPVKEGQGDGAGEGDSGSGGGEGTGTGNNWTRRR